MTKKTSRFSPAYRGTLPLIFIEQIPLGLLAGMIMDDGCLGAMFFFTLVAFWAGFALIIIRRPRTPTEIDIFLIKWGTLLLFGLSFVMASVIWRWRGAT
jgi:hypothetical protein